MKFLLCSCVNLVQVSALNSLLSLQANRVSYCSLLLFLAQREKKNVLIYHFPEFNLTIFMNF